MPERSLILIVDDNEDDYIIVSRLVSPEYKTLYVPQLYEVQKKLEERKPICILLDYHMGLYNGIEVLRDIKKCEPGKKTPVIMITGEKNYRIVVECMKEGAADYLVKEDYTKARILEVIAKAIKASDRETRIEREREEAKKLAETDELTGVWNRRYLLEKLRNKIENRQSQIQSLDRFAVVFFDVDRFKSINDTYGHLAGDVLLKNITAFVQEQIRDYDFIGRYGGDEFIVVLNQNSDSHRSDFLLHACRRLDEIRQAIERRSISIPEGDRPIHISLSIGVTEFSGQPTTVADILSEADKALYHAKQQGRNRVAYFSQGQLYLFESDSSP
ncbi:GGDEF domain-containing response regulator [Baaleninema sp.]|uniref:GGDEF domain-containing response regulator n=1 Tax=Baaleninema sp. TaxID=3101197 RepID=UPI003D01FBD1